MSYTHRNKHALTNSVSSNNMDRQFANLNCACVRACLLYGLYAHVIAGRQKKELTDNPKIIQNP